MSELWINKWKPKNIKDIIGNTTAINDIDEWLKTFNNQKMKSLLISGNLGIGKTLIIKLLLEKYNYYTKIINPDDIKDYRISEDFNDFYNFKNSIKQQITFINEKKQNLAIIFDNIETISLLNEKKFIQEIQKINMKKHLFPLIFISNNNHSKLVSDLKKYSIEIKIYSPSTYDMLKLVKKICMNENIIINNNESIIKLIEFSQNDIRRLINILQDYSYSYKNINNNNVEEFITKSIKKNTDISLYEATISLLNNYDNYDTIYNLYETEKVLLPLMIQENYYKKVFSTQNKHNFKEQLKQASNIIDSLSLGDNIETSIYTDQNWYLQNIHCFYTCIDTSYWVNKNGQKLNYSNIKFSADLNKTSLKNINKKNISNLTKIIGKKSIFEILMLCNLSNELMKKNNSDIIINKLKEYKNDIDIKDIELCLKIDKTIEFITLSTKEKKELNI
jgi:replication factor C subunit 1